MQKIVEKKLVLPDRALFDFEIIKYARLMKIRHFRGVYCIDRLPSTPKIKEAVVVNLDFEKNRGTHWVCYRKIGNHVDYYDSFGNLPPPTSLQKYLKGCEIEYNYERDQSFGSENCGQFCLKFLKTF